MASVNRLAALVWLVLCAGAAAQEAPALSATLMTRDIVVAEDGHTTTTMHVEIHIGNDSAAMSGGQQNASFSADTESLEIVEAYTRKPDGKRIAVAPSSIYEQQAPGTQQVLMYTDQRQKVIVFPQVGAGDDVVYTARVVQKAPLMAGQFWYGDIFNLSAAIREVRESVTVPKAMALHVDTHDLAYSRDETATQVVHRWTYAAATNPAEEKDDDFALARTPHFHVSTFKDYAALGAAYAQLAEPRIAVTPQISQQADEITRGVTDRRRQAQLVYEWVSRRIRYVGIELGVGGYVPHDADSVLRNGYGDCKDHAVLLAALLKAKGIEAEMVLINAGNQYALSPVAAFQFDHVITWLPEFRMYVDSTAGVAPFGVLPQEEYGKPVVHAVATGGSLRTVPLLAPGQSETAMITTATLDEHGTLTGKTISRASGPVSISLCGVGLGIQALGAVKAAAALLKNAGYESGSGSFDPAVPTDLKSDFTLSSSFSVPNWSGRFAESGGSYLPGGIRLLEPAGVGVMGDTPSDGKVEGDARCFSTHAVEDISLQAPPGRHFQEAPRNVEVKSDNLAFSTRWTLEGDRISVHREFTSHFDKPFCTAAMRKANLPALRKISDSYDAAISFSATDTLALLTDEISKSPEDAAKLYQRGTAYYGKGDYDRAIADYRRAAVLKPGDPDNFTALADSYREKGDWARMLQNANHAVLLRPDDEEFLLLRSDAYHAIGYQARARADAGRVISLNGSNARAYYARALAYQSEENCAKAIADFSKAIAIQSDLTNARLQRARCYGTIREFDKEIADADSALAAQSNMAFAYYIRAQGHEGRGEIALAIADYGEALRQSPDYTAASSARASLYIAGHDYVRATADYARILTLHPDYAAYVEYRGTEFLNKGDYDGAIAAYSAGTGIAGVSRAHIMHRAYAYIAKGDLDSAITDLTSFLPDSNQPGLMTMLRAIAWRGQKNSANSAADYAQALKLYDRRIAAHPADGIMIVERCWGRAIFGDELELALADCEKGTAMLKAHEDGYLARGLVNYKLGRFEQALADYDAAVKMNDKSSDSLYMRGVTRIRLGRSNEGKADIDAALKISAAVAKTYAFYGVAA
jgi:tetratricopeptide (TPR) repeat protein/transglutaminase-like putative cysteine protease